MNEWMNEWMKSRLSCCVQLLLWGGLRTIWLLSLNSGGQFVCFHFSEQKISRWFVKLKQIVAENDSVTSQFVELLSLCFLSVQQPVGVTSAAACRISVWESHRRTFLSSVLSSSVWWRRQIWVERKTTCSTLSSCWRSTRGGKEWRWESWRTARAAAGRRSTRRREPGTETLSSPGSWRGSRCVLSRSCATVAAENRSSSPSRHPTWPRWFRRAAPAEDPGPLSCSWCRLWSACCRGWTAALRHSWSLGRCWFIRAETAAGRQDHDQLWRSSALFRLTPTRTYLNDWTGDTTGELTTSHLKKKLTCSFCTSEGQKGSDVLIREFMFTALIRL